MKRLDYRMIGAAIVLVVAGWAVNAHAAYLDPSEQIANASVIVSNKSGIEVREIYASDIGDNDWQDDLLGSYVLYPDQEIELDLRSIGSCYVDLRAVFSDGRETIRRQFNACMGIHWNIRPSR